MGEEGGLLRTDRTRTFAERGSVTVGWQRASLCALGEHKKLAGGPDIGTTETSQLSRICRGSLIHLPTCKTSHLYLRSRRSLT